MEPKKLDQSLLDSILELIKFGENIDNEDARLLAGHVLAISDELKKERHNKAKTDIQFNHVAGISSGVLVSLGLPWESDVAKLCNFVEPPEETKKKWDNAARRAIDRIHKYQKIAQLLQDVCVTPLTGDKVMALPKSCTLVGVACRFARDLAIPDLKGPAS